MTNYQKLVAYSVLFSRYYRQLLGIYFLTLPWMTPAHISIYVAIFLLWSFICEIPSWYLGDTFGHRKTLILAQVVMCLGATTLALASWLRIFGVWCFLLALWQSLHSGTKEAYFHEILEDQWKEKEFWPLRGKLKWDASFFAIFFLIWFPLLAWYHITVPFRVWAGMHAIWSIFGYFLHTPKKQSAIQESQSMKQIIISQKWTGFYLLVWFFVIIWSLYASEQNFKQPYVVNLWLAVQYLWIMIGFSKFMMRCIWRSSILKKLNSLPLISFMLFDMCFFFLWYFLVSRGFDPYITLVIFASTWAYYNSRKWIMKKHLLKTLSNKKYKATVLSIYSQIESMLWAVVVIWVWYIMATSYQTWYLVIWVTLLVLLSLYMIFIILPASKKEQVKHLFLPLK